ncbi:MULTISPECIES: DUF7546 family protein [Halolamina]|uniref:Uncharacterized protein n=1 Tax=Halolamina pelagica TaxID=699431 RepID=A0A1I5P027_9EURY|nr:MULTISPECIES: hypothetical protein [Halolamina]NHX36560.1 hypothetical protein [Halolamina sp. R1-12]SFP27353.1 hypothetical protein SAMN05216277_102278 [Halolamina pelagica]
MQAFDTPRIDDLPEPRTVLLWTAVLYVEVMALTGYWLFGDTAAVTSPRFALYGLLWINVSLWAFYRTDVPDASTTAVRRAAVLALGYLAVLAYTGGVVAPGIPATFDYTAGFSVLWLPPGWGPAVTFKSEVVRLILMPAKMVGYLALTYLVFVTVLDVSKSAVSGLLGLLSCVSCSWPILASVGAAAFGGGSFVAVATTTYAYDVSTAVFLVTIALLSWRPSFR